MAEVGYDWKRVTEAEMRAFIAQFPDCESYVTGICEPPQTVFESPPSRPTSPGRAIASITHGDWPEGRKRPDWNAKVYKVNAAAARG